MRQLIFRRLYYTGISKLPEKQQSEVYDAIMRYAFNGELVEVSDASKPIFATIIESVNNDIERYESRHKGGR